MKKKKQEIKDFIENNSLYDFSLYEQRILYRCLILVYKFYKGKNIKDCYEIIFYNDYFSIGMPVSTILKEEKDENYSLIKKALLSLNSKRISYSDDKATYYLNLIDRTQITYEDNCIRLILYPSVYHKLMDSNFEINLYGN